MPTLVCDAKHIRDTCPKPSDALTAMIVGLRKFAGTPNCSVDMGTYGRRHDGICFGCAATAAALMIEPELPISWLDRYTDYPDVADFEKMINFLRNGVVVALLQYYSDLLGYPDYARLKRSTPLLPVLDSDDWEQGLPAYEAYRDQLKALGY